MSSRSAFAGPAQQTGTIALPADIERHGEHRDDGAGVPGVGLHQELLWICSLFGEVRHTLEIPAADPIREGFGDLAQALPGAPYQDQIVGEEALHTVASQILVSYAGPVLGEAPVVGRGVTVEV